MSPNDPKRTSTLSVCDRSRSAELYLAQGERERNRCDGDENQRPEHIDVGEQGYLRLHLLSDPVGGLLVRLGQRTAMGHEIIRRLFQRGLELDGRVDVLTSSTRRL
jgi:hypothetical protein